MRSLYPSRMNTSECWSSRILSSLFMPRSSDPPTPAHPNLEVGNIPASCHEIHRFSSFRYSWYFDDTLWVCSWLLSFSKTHSFTVESKNSANSASGMMSWWSMSCRTQVIQTAAKNRVTCLTSCSICYCNVVDSCDVLSVLSPTCFLVVCTVLCISDCCPAWWLTQRPQDVNTTQQCVSIGRLQILLSSWCSHVWCDVMSKHINVLQILMQFLSYFINYLLFYTPKFLDATTLCAIDCRDVNAVIRLFSWMPSLGTMHGGPGGPVSCKWRWKTTTTKQ